MKKRIVHKNGNYFVIGDEKNGYKVCKNGAVAATVVSTFGRGLPNGYLRAIADCDRRANDDKR